MAVTRGAEEEVGTHAEGASGPPAPKPDFWTVARSGPVVRRALVYLIVVGGILVAINHGDALLRGDLDASRLVKILITPLVPYAVSTLSSVSAIRDPRTLDRPTR